ncbi:MAG: recombination mediator RecR [Bacteroidales bacterium]|jgi:recombination protein RecR|nr:recombination mediator RecR [Bacteroidales bacterium]
MGNFVQSKLVQKAVDELSSLPTIGTRSALRLALYILKQDKNYAKALSEAIQDMRDNIKYCRVCHNISDDDICNICANTKRNHNIVCIVEDVTDVLAIENTAQYNGVYHVLGGVISPINGIGINDLNISSLLNRVETDKIQEAIIALPTSVEGDTTALYLYKKLSEYKNIEITTIARGVAFGYDLEYTDQITLGRSIINRIPYQYQISSKSSN